MQRWRPLRGITDTVSVALSSAFPEVDHTLRDEHVNATDSINHAATTHYCRSNIAVCASSLKRDVNRVNKSFKARPWTPEVKPSKMECKSSPAENVSIGPTFCEFIFVFYKTVTVIPARGLEHVGTIKKTLTTKNRKCGNCEALQLKGRPTSRHLF